MPPRRPSKSNSHGSSRRARPSSSGGRSSSGGGSRSSSRPSDGGTGAPGSRPSGPRPGGGKPKTGPDLSVAQARNVAIVVHEMILHILETRRPADRELSSFFRNNKKFGSRDRRLVSECLYSVFRWWGWLGPHGRDEARLWSQPSEEVADDPAWLMIVLGAHLLDGVGDPHPIALRWRDMLQDLQVPLHHVDCVGDRPMTERGAYIGELFGLTARHWKDLAPAWFFQHVPLPRQEQGGLVESFQSRPPIWLRVQNGTVEDAVKDLRTAGLAPQTGEQVPTAIRLKTAERVNLFELPSFRNGAFEVQDLASQCIGIACEARKGQRWWDVCAGAGGKSLQLGAMMKGQGLVVATDIRDWKLEDLKKRARRAQLSNITTREFSGEGIPAKGPTFDGVLVDAPCSCTGTWRRNPDARWTTRVEDIAEMAEIQYGILENAVAGLKPGGLLVYATCSVMEAENEAVTLRFLTAHPEFALDPFVHPLTGEQTTGQFRVWPTDADCDATYIARLRHRG